MMSMQITVQFLNGKEDVITVDPTYTISKVKESISHSTIQNYMRLVHSGRTMADQKTVADYKLKEGDKLFLVFDLRGGGNDGGSIPTRGEMVKTKKAVRRTDPALLKRVRWLNCSLTKQPLQSPVVVDDLGNVFNKESLLKCLVEKSLPSRFNHIRSIKNVFDVQFSLNRKYDPSHQVQVGKEAANLDSPYECLITGRPINGQYAFSAIKTCGHVFSEKGLQQSKSQTLACIICQKSYTLDDIVQLNPDKPTQEALKLKLQQSNKEKKAINITKEYQRNKINQNNKKKRNIPRVILIRTRTKRLRNGSQVNSKANVLQRSKKFLHRHRLLLDLLREMFWQLKMLCPRSEITTTPKNAQVMPTSLFFRPTIHQHPHISQAFLVL